MGSFGDRMKREREMRGIKLEEIAESTKIGKRNLVALEEEHFDQLPGGIFNKGFVRAYARFLGLDEEQAVNDFLAASANYDQPAALQPPPTSLVKAPVIPSDASVQRLKGPARPIISERERAELVSALAAVDAMTFFDEDTPRELIAAVLPDVLVKGADWSHFIAGREEVEAAGGRVIAAPLRSGYSTTGILEKLLAHQP